MTARNSRNMAVVATPRYLCSQLVRLRVRDQPECWVNLEEIWDTGALLDCEAAVQEGAPARIASDDVAFSGVVTAVEPHEFGWRVELVFAPGVRWTPEQWIPEHALDPGSLVD